MPLTEQTLILRANTGEDSHHQFKENIHNAESLAAEMVAFSNSDGGTIYLGIADDGSVPGLSGEDAARINQMIGNAASQLIRSPINVSTENVLLANGRIVIAVTVPQGLDKPYFDKNGIIWLKNGADKRRINNKEELRRIFQFSNQFHADELPTKADIAQLDAIRFRDFLENAFGQPYPESQEALVQLLKNLNLASEQGSLNLAGTLLFARHPERIVPQFIVKAIRYPGTEIHSTDYLDTEDFSGPLEKVYQDAMAFIMRNLPKVQAGRNVNAPGTPEIAKVVFEELLVNALSHRDYLVSAPIRIFFFDDRIEIISPGNLPNNLTVAKIKAGNSNIRNPILVSYIAKGLLPYHGLGSGITRALKNWKDIIFENDIEGCLFKVTVKRPSNSQTKAALQNTPEQLEESASGYAIAPSIPQPETPDAFKKLNATCRKVLDILKSQPDCTVIQAAEQLGISPRTVSRATATLQQKGLLKRIGADKNGYWKATIA